MNNQKFMDTVLSLMITGIVSMGVNKLMGKLVDDAGNKEFLKLSGAKASKKQLNAFEIFCLMDAPNTEVLGELSEKKKRKLMKKLLKQIAEIDGIQSEEEIKSKMLKDLLSGDILRFKDAEYSEENLLYIVSTFNNVSSLYTGQ